MVRCADDVAPDGAAATFSAVIGAAVAAVGRHTAAALGVVFVWTAVIEGLIRGFRPHWTPWLLGDNLVSFLSWESPEVQFAPFDSYSMTPGRALSVLRGLHGRDAGARVRVRPRPRRPVTKNPSLSPPPPPPPPPSLPLPLPLSPSPPPPPPSPPPPPPLPPSLPIALSRSRGRRGSRCRLAVLPARARAPRVRSGERSPMPSVRPHPTRQRPVPARRTARRLLVLR